MFKTIFKSAATAAALAVFSIPAMANTIAANTGWIYDNLSARLSATDGSPFTFSLTAGQTASFKVTDQFVPGDSFDLLSSSLFLTSSSAYAGAANAVIGDSNGESGWLNAIYEKIDYVVTGAGSYSFDIFGDGVGGIPAGLYVRLDVTEGGSVPEPASLALLGLGLAGLGFSRRRKA